MKTSPPYEDPLVSPDAPEAQAWDWLRLLTSGTADAEDALAFRHWVRSSPAHQAAYNHAKHQWDAFRQPAGALRHRNPEVAAFFQPRAPRAAAPRRRAFLGAGVGAAAAAVAGLAVLGPPGGLWARPAEWGADDRTAIGEQRALEAVDRVTVTLNTRTSVRRQMGEGGTVGLELLAGETAIDFKEAGRPFAVVAGVGRSLAESGRFEVRHLNAKVCVTCFEGAVRVEHPAGDRSLQARQQLVYDADSVSGLMRIDLAAVSAWRNGVLIFNETRLVDALAEINRYRAGRVVLMNDAARNRAVSGRFAIASLDLALIQLQNVVGLKRRSLPGGLILLS